MSFLTWNVRGLNLKERRQDLKEHLRNLKPSVLGQVETKVRVHNKQRIISYFPRHW